MERQKIYDAIKSASEPVTPKELSEITDVKVKTVKKVLSIFINDGKAQKAGYGKYELKR